MPAHRLSRELAEAAVKAVDAAGGNISKAADAIGIARPTLENRLRAAKLQGLTPRPRATVFATSTLIDGEGKQVLQWVKEKHGERSPEQWAEHVKDTFVDARPVKPIPAPKGRLARNLLAVYPIGDHHVAMYAWAEETGADYDIKIAERLLVHAMQHLTSVTEDCEEALIVNLGDFFHVDNLHNETSRSGNTLDVDTRYAAMIRAGVRMMRAIIDLALAKHRRVRVVNAIGNHDDIGALWFSLTLSCYYENNPRVTIDTSPSKFYYQRFGKVLIGVTHGDTGKPEKLQGVMAADRPAEWGATTHRYWLTGHVHSRRVLEFQGVCWETFRTLAPGDAWSVAAAYRAGRDMTSIVFDAEHGEIARHRFAITMLKEAA